MEAAQNVFPHTISTPTKLAHTNALREFIQSRDAVAGQGFT